MTKTPPISAGQKFNRLTAIRFSQKSSTPSPSHDYWLFLCDCGKITESKACHVKAGGKTSCGCYQREVLVERNTTHNLTDNVKAGYSSWQNMWTRCTNPAYHSYHRYGGRGIKVCVEWKDFVKFHEDMGDRPTNNHTIDRINPDGNYEPTNCRWVTMLEQNQNRSSL